MAFLRLAPRAAPRALPVARLYHTSQRLRFPYKDDQDRESLKPRANEYTKSGSDEEVAANSEAAFDPKKTSPEEEQATAGAGTDPGNPLEASPSNQEFNKPRGDEKSSRDRGLGEEVRKGGASKKMSSQKKGNVPGQ